MSLPLRAWDFMPNDGITDKDKKAGFLIRRPFYLLVRQHITGMTISPINGRPFYQHRETYSIKAFSVKERRHLPHVLNKGKKRVILNIFGAYLAVF